MHSLLVEATSMSKELILVKCASLTIKYKRNKVRQSDMKETTVKENFIFKWREVETLTIQIGPTSQRENNMRKSISICRQFSN